MNTSSLAPAALLLLLAVAACDDDPARGKTQVSAAAPLTATEAPASAVKYGFSNVDSQVQFVGAKVTRKHDGSFQAFTGTVSLVDGDPAKSSVTTAIDVASIKTDEDKLTNHLKSGDFLDAAKFPKAIFTSTSIQPGADEAAPYAVTGNLQLHGVTKSITFPATVKAGGNSVDVDAEFAIHRKDFGVVYPGMPDDLIKDDVLLKLHVHAHRAGPV